MFKDTMILFFILISSSTSFADTKQVCGLLEERTENGTVQYFISKGPNYFYTIETNRSPDSGHRGDLQLKLSNSVGQEVCVVGREVKVTAQYYKIHAGSIDVSK